MKTLILELLFLLIISTSFGQTIEVSGGVNRNKYFDLIKEDGHFISEYNPDYGYSFGISISDFKVDTFKLRMSLLVDCYNGKFYTRDGGLGGGFSTRAEVCKTTIGVGLFPINLTVCKRLKVSIGGEISFKLFDETSGQKYFELMYVGGSYSTIENDSVRINRKAFFGFSGRISYDIRIKENWYVSPQYKFYFGKTNEFINTESNIKSMRHNLLIGIVRKFK